MRSQMKRPSKDFMVCCAVAGVVLAVIAFMPGLGVSQPGWLPALLFGPGLVLAFLFGFPLMYQGVHSGRLSLLLIAAWAINAVINGSILLMLWRTGVKLFRPSPAAEGKSEAG